MIPPGHNIGILGGGQLGTFFCAAAKRQGYFVTVWDPDPEAPAHAWADARIIEPFDDPAARRLFMGCCEAATYEWENIPVEIVAEIEAKILVRPDSRVLSLLQNRISEKDFLSEHGFPVTPYLHVREIAQLHAAVKTLGLPVVCKTVVSGYDGQGQWRIARLEEIAPLAPQLRASSSGWIVEKWVPFSRELSVVAVRSETGAVAVYPLVENRHEEGILRECRVPAKMDSGIADKASMLAEAVLAALENVGVFCIEFFLLEDGALMINEIAPRPHNSGHYSLDVCSVSQFEQQLRVLCGLPLKNPQLFSPAVMINILGEEIRVLSSEKDLATLLEIEGCRLYHYRKNTIKARRKMGHITLTNAKPEALETQADLVRSLLERAARPAGVEPF